MRGGGAENGQDYRQHEGQPFEQAAEVVAGGGKDGVGGVAVGPGEIVSAHAMLGFGVSDDRFDRRAAGEFAFDGLSDRASLAGDIDLELVVGRSIVAAIAAVGDAAGYEFGVKVLFAALNRSKGGHFIARVKAMPGNPYDGRTLTSVIPEIETQIGANLCGLS